MKMQEASALYTEIVEICKRLEIPSDFFRETHDYRNDESLSGSGTALMTVATSVMVYLTEFMGNPERVFEVWLFKDNDPTLFGRYTNLTEAFLEFYRVHLKILLGLY